MSANSNRFRLHLIFVLGRINYINGGILPPQSVGQGAYAGTTSVASAVGAKADIVLVDLKHPAMRPKREPLRSLLYLAAERAVRDVYVDGRLVVKYGHCLDY